MKALKIFRLAALVFTFLCLVLSLVYNFIDVERDWYVILILVLFIVFSPFSLIARMKNEADSANLATTKKVMLITHNILLILILGVFLFCFSDGIRMSHKTIFFLLGAFFAALYQICGNIIIYKAKKEYDAKKTKNMKRILFFTAAIICICGCEKPRNDKCDYSVQPEIPMYDQLLLKGDVKKVTEIYVSDFGTSTETFTFDESGKLIFYAYNDEELGSYADLRSIMFPWICGTYANFVFPSDWTKYDNRTETRTFTMFENGNVTHEIEKKIEYEWDRNSGRFTKVRCYINNEPVSLAGIEDGYNIEEYLYYSNGLPHYDFNFAEELWLYTEVSYDGFDDRGNPLVIELSTPNGDFTITRQIEYY